VGADWRSGTPLLLDGAAAAIAGEVFSKHGPPAEEGEEAEKDAQRSFLAGRTVITAGLALLPVTFEPQVLESNRWGRLFSLAYNHPEQPAFAVGGDTGLAITSEGATVLGAGTVIALDLRRAARALGGNEAYVLANGLLDVFAPGDRVEPAAP
jgi:cyanophycinase-like exopeptidase